MSWDSTAQAGVMETGEGFGPPQMGWWLNECACPNRWEWVDLSRPRVQCLVVCSAPVPPRPADPPSAPAPIPAAAGAISAANLTPAFMLAIAYFLARQLGWLK